MDEAASGIDEIVDNGSIVQVVFHIRRDWDSDGEAARSETIYKSERCAEFIRSPSFKERFGMKPGVILMKSARLPPPEIHEQLARLGADVEVGSVGLVGKPATAGSVTCALCGRGGFLMPQMCMTDRGLACPACFQTWDARQSASLTRSSGSALQGSDARMIRFVLGIAFAIIYVGLRACTH